MGYMIADLYVRDVQQSLAYYRDVLGFEVKGEWTPEGQPTSWGHVALGECQVMFGSLHSAYEGQYAQPPEFRQRLEQNQWGVAVTIFLRQAVPDVDAHFAQVKGAGARVVEEPHSTPYGWRLFVVEDPDGYRISFADDLKEA